MHTKTPTIREAGDLDILKHVAVNVPCGACGQYYQVTLRQVLLSQAMLHEGCTGRSDTECPPLTYASLATEDVLRELEASWTRIMRQVQSNGMDLGLCEPGVTH